MRKKRDSSGRKSSGGGVLWLSLGLILINIVVYSPLAGYGFVSYDDPQYVTDNPHVLAGLTWEGVKWAMVTQDASNWHPLTWLSYMLDVQMFGLDAGWHHTTNIVLHIASTLLLFLVLRRMTGAPLQSAFVAGLFAVHPLNVQSVAWIADRKDVLSTVLWMLALWAYVRYVHRPGADRYLLVFLLFGLGLTAKSMLVTFPFVLLLLDFWPLSRVTLSAGTLPQFIRLVREKVPLFILTIASSIVTFVTQRHGGALETNKILPLSARIAIAMVSYVTYVVKLFVPTGLAILYPVPQVLPAWRTGAAIVILIAVSVLVLLAARRYAYLPVGWFWFLGTLLPVAGFIQIGDHAMADRYMYIPSIGLFLIVAWGMGDLLSYVPQPDMVMSAMAATVIVACMIAAVREVHYWASNVALWQRALEVTENNYIAENNFAESLDDSRAQEAILHLSQALRIAPDYAPAHENIGVRLAKLGHTEEALSHFKEAIRLDPSIAEAHSDLGVLLQQQGKVDEAIEQYSEALRLDPLLTAAHNNLENALLKKGQIPH